MLRRYASPSAPPPERLKNAPSPRCCPTSSAVPTAVRPLRSRAVLLFGVPGAEPEALNCILLWASVSLSCCVFASVIVPSTPDESAREPRTMLRYLHTHLLVLTGVGTAVALAPYGPVHRGLVPVLLAMALAPLGIALAPCWDRQRALREGDEAPLPTVGLLWHVEGAAAAAPALTTLPILKLESSVSYTTLQMLIACGLRADCVLIAC